jgi:prepilin-type N-terminal cleavage/methylation domain-containing protein
MVTRLRKALAREHGFTLIELVVVTAFLGLLMALALQSYTGVRKRAALEEARQIGREWRSRAWSCFLRNSRPTACSSSSAIGFSESNAVHWAFERGTYSTDASTITFSVPARSGDPLVSGEVYIITLTTPAGATSDRFSP